MIKKKWRQTQLADMWRTTWTWMIINKVEVSGNS